MKKSLIRKQPRREARRQLRPYFKNPFKEQKLPIPQQIENFISGLTLISLRAIQAPFPIPQRSFPNLLQQMKEALAIQQSKISNLLPTEQFFRQRVQLKEYGNIFQGQIEPIPITTQDEWENSKNQDYEDMFFN